MSTPAKATRRNTRTAGAADDGTPVSSHPLGEDPSPAGAASVKKQSKNGSKGPTGNPVAVILLAVTLIAGGITYNRLVLRPAELAADAARRSLLEQGGEAPLPPMTPEEIAVFEMAAEEHYGLPPGYQLPDVEPYQQPPPENYEEEFEAEAVAEAAVEAATDDHNDISEWELPEGEEYELGEDGQAELEDGHGEAASEGEHAEVLERAVSNADEEAAAAAAANFDPEVHQGYLDLPAWPTTDEASLTGSWDFNPQVYNYAASLPMTQVLSWEGPRLLLLPSFLSPEEVRHMVKISKDNLERSEVLVAEGEETQSNIRTSFGFWPDSDEVIDRITERMHRTIGVPQEFGEGLYVLNYQVDQKYEAHNDHCMDGFGDNVAEPACLDFLKRAGGPECGPGKGGPTCGDRVATFILYLKSPTRGGQTAFPEADITKAAMGSEHRSGNAPDEWYCGDSRVLSAAPSPGTGVLFWDYRPGNGSGTGSFLDGSAHPAAETVYAAMHSGCPVEDGEKYIATRWIRAAGFDYHLRH